MTEPKRKRGRPPGSGKKKNEIQNNDLILPGNLGEITSPDGHKRPIQKILKKNDGSVTLTIGPHSPVNDPVSLDLPEGVTELGPVKGVKPGGLAIDAQRFKRPFPDNFFSLSKIDKLQWLTANKI